MQGRSRGGGGGGGGDGGGSPFSCCASPRSQPAAKLVPSAQAAGWESPPAAQRGKGKGVPPPAPPLPAGLLALPRSRSRASSDSDDENEPFADEVCADGELLLAGRAVPFARARFGPNECELPAGSTAAAADPPLVDAPLRNGADLAGVVGVAERGVVSFVAKARRLQEAGCVCALFVNSDEQLFTVGGEDGAGSTSSAR